MVLKVSTWFKNIPTYTVWVILFLFYFAIGAQIDTLRGMVLAASLTPIQFIMYNMNIKKFMPKYYDNNKRKFRIYNAILILLLSVLGIIIEIIYFNFYPEMRPPHKGIIFPLIFHIVICLVAFWISMTKYLINKQEKTNIEIETLKREKAESELKFLKTQINPHFLFNALNNIYSMAYTGDESAPEKITMLSDMLRYVLYDCESDFISLYKEIDYINSFMEFQQLKTEKRQNIHFNIGSYDENYQIAPMLLVTFVENGFKHSKIEKDKNGFVNITIKQSPEKFYFYVENSIPQEPTTKTAINKRGIGIENARNRLDLLYPKKYKLEINNNNKTNKVKLELYK